MTSFPQDIYARNLLSYRGYPLWTPEPNIELPGIYQLEGLKLGDVGVVVPEEGSFDVFFNITLPREHPLHAADGVPTNFTQVKLRREDYRIVPDAESPGRVISHPSVDCAVSCTDPHYIDGMAHRLTDHQFDLHRNEGAMLVLPQGAERHRLAKGLLLLDVIIQNAVDWYRFARENLYRDITNDALYLITGFHKAPSWSLASFENIGATSVHCKIVQHRTGTGSMLADHSTWETIRPLEWRIGPRHSVSIPNQSVFITGFKIAINEELLHLRRVTVKAEHSKRTLATKLVGWGAGLANLLLGPVLDAAHSGEADSQNQEAIESTLGTDSARDEIEGIKVERIPQLSQPFHPSDIINRYMLKKEPSAKIAVTHDSQWIALLEKGKLNGQDIVQEGRLEEVVSQEYNIICRDGAVYLESIDEPTDVDAVFDVHDTDPTVSKERTRAFQAENEGLRREISVSSSRITLPRDQRNSVPAIGSRGDKVHSDFALSLIPTESSSSHTPARTADTGSLTRQPDRRFFLPPSPEDVSLEREDGSTASGKSPSDLFDASSAASIQMKSVSTDVDAVEDSKEDREGEGEEEEEEEEEEDDDRRSTAAAGAGARHPAHGRQNKPERGKEAGKRPQVKRSHSATQVALSVVPKLSAQRQQHPPSDRAKKKGAMFNIGSGSSNGSRSANDSTDKGQAQPSPVVNAFTLTAAQPSKALPPPVNPPVEFKKFVGHTAARHRAPSGNAKANVIGDVNSYVDGLRRSRRVLVIASIDKGTDDEDSEERSSEEMDTEDKLRKAEGGQMNEGAAP